MKNKYNKGFTLIELMVVVSIIALLSTIVLASLKDARDKGTATKFKAEMMQLVNALEIYRGSNGKYPYEDTYSSGITPYSSTMSNANTETISSGGTSLSTLLASQIKTLPKVPANSYAGGTNSWAYFSNYSITPYRCAGDTVTPKYVILFYTANTVTFNIFSNLPLTEQFNGSTWPTVATGEKCYSLK